MGEVKKKKSLFFCCCYCCLEKTKQTNENSIFFSWLEPKFVCYQRSSFFNCLLDVAAGTWAGNGRHEDDEASCLLSRRNTQRSKSKKMDMQDVVIPSRRPSVDSLQNDTHLHPTASYRSQNRNRSRSPSIRRARSPGDHGRSPSPRRMYHHHDIGFSDTVSNVVEIVKHEHSHMRRYPHIRDGRYCPCGDHHVPVYMGAANTYDRSWSASPSPARSPSPTGGRYRHNDLGGGHRGGGYGTTSLEQRSRSPSPRPHPHRHTQHSYPVLVTRRGQGRRLPPTPTKPSTLQLTPAAINFPKLNASPTRNYPGPMSFEQAVAIGRGGRLLPSPVPNGYKPAQPSINERHSDSDDDDWC